MDSLRLKGTARGGAPVIGENGAALGQHGLLKNILRDGPARADKVAADAPGRLLVVYQLFSKGLGQDVFGQVIAGGAQTAGGDDDVRPLSGDVHRPADPLGVVPHHSVVIDIQSQGAQPLGEHLRIGIDNVAQQQLGSHRQDLHGMRHNKQDLSHPGPRRGCCDSCRHYNTAPAGRKGGRNTNFPGNRNSLGRINQN